MPDLREAFNCLIVALALAGVAILLIGVLIGSLL